MRSLFLCAVALASLCSAAQAGQIRIMGVVANYVTAQNVVDVEIWLDRPLDMRTEWLSFGGGHPYVVDGTFDGPMFGFGNGPTNAPPLSYFNLSAWRRTNGSVTDRTTISDIPITHMEIDRNGVASHVMVATLLADDIRLASIIPDNAGRLTFAFSTTLRFINDNGHLDIDSVSGISTVNSPRLIHSPEPSSLVLLGLAHLIWLPSARQRFRKWRARREADWVSRHTEIA